MDYASFKSPAFLHGASSFLHIYMNILLSRERLSLPRHLFVIMASATFLIIVLPSPLSGVCGKLEEQTSNSFISEMSRYHYLQPVQSPHTAGPVSALPALDQHSAATKNGVALQYLEDIIMEIEISSASRSPGMDYGADTMVDTSQLIILSEGHQLCQLCTDNLGLRQSKIRDKPYHQDLAALLQAASLPCYICALYYDAVFSRRPAEWPSGVLFSFLWSDSGGLLLHNPNAALPAMMFGRDRTFWMHQSADDDVKSIDFNPEVEVAEPSENTGYAAVLQYASDWLDTCVKDYSCRRENPEVPWYPTRLLDVNKLRLVLTSEEAVSGPYATLSYRWGDKPSFFTLTAENIEQLRSSIDLELLPKVFCDALEVCRHLSIRYLWIDALCIIQSGKGSSEDWAAEGVQMRNVYLYCQINISASCASQPKMVSSLPGIPIC